MNMNLNLHLGAIAASHYKGQEKQAERSDAREKEAQLRFAQIISKQMGGNQVQKSDNGKGHIG